MKPKLSQRQLAMLACFAQGMTQPEVAREFKVSYETVRQHVRRMRTMGLRFNVPLARLGPPKGSAGHSPVEKPISVLTPPKRDTRPGAARWAAVAKWGKGDVCRVIADTAAQAVRECTALVAMRAARQGVQGPAVKVGVIR